MKKQEWIDGLMWTVRHWWLIIAVALFVFIETKSCTRRIEDNRKADVIIDSFFVKSLDSSAMKYWKDKYNVEHAVISLMYAVTTDNNRYKDSIAKLLSIKEKQLASIEETRIQGGGGGSVITDYDSIVLPCPSATIVKTIDRVRFTYDTPNDPWIKIKGSIGVNHSQDSISYSTIDSITSIAYWKRKKVLGLKIGAQEGYVDFASSNPHNKITGGKRLDFKIPKKQYSVSASVSVGYPFDPSFNIAKPRISIGISIGKTLIRF